MEVKMTSVREFKRLFSRKCIVLLPALLLGLGLAGTAQAEVEPWDSYTSEGAVYGGTYRTHIAPPRSLDPHQETAVFCTAITLAVYNTLLRLSPDMQSVELDLAKSWRQIDDRTYEFKIHEGVRFQDVPPVNGRECTSADVKYSIERVAGMHGRKVKFRHRYYFENKLEAIETPDKYTIIFKTKEPYAPFIKYIASPWTEIVPKELVDQERDLRRKAIGTGPFILKEYVKGSHVTLVKNPNYFKKGSPYLDKVHFKLMRDPNAALSGFLANRFDAMSPQFFQVPTIKKEDPDARIRIREGMNTFVLRCPPWIEGKKPLQPPFDKKKVRQAIGLAIDKERLLKLAWGGQGTPAVGPIPAGGVPWALGKEEQIEYNPEKARKYLADAGYPNGFKSSMITFNLPFMTKPAQVVQEMLAQVGIDVDLQILEFAQYFNRAYRFQYEMAFHVMGAFVDPEEYLVPYFGPVEGSSMYKWSNPEVWDMISKQTHIMDPVKRTAYVQDIQRKLIEDSPNIFLYSQLRFSVNKPYVHSRLFMNNQQSYVEYTWMEKH
jgi:peptide/nickel transport system substrate-binding protein